MAHVVRDWRDEPVGQTVKNVWETAPSARVALSHEPSVSPMKKERAGLRVKLLGGFETRLVTGAPVTLPTRKAQALLAYLAVRPAQAYARDKLTSLLWGDRGDVQARDSLRHTLVALRKILPERPTSLTGDRRAVALDPAAVDVDVVRFETLVKSASAKDLAEAAETYQGDFLEGFVLREPPFEEWLVAERERLRELALGALRRLLDLHVEAGASEPAIRTALRLLVLDATQETAHRALMRLYVHQGRRAAALRQYQTCVGVLQRELGTEPEPATRDLYQGIVQRREAAPSGKVRLEPPRKAPRPTRPESVTAETPLIGRDSELATLRNAMTEAEWGHGRVAAVIGEAGVGKTRLLSEVAAEASARGSRVLFGRSYESAQILPFGPWVDAFRAGGLIVDDVVVGGLSSVWRAELTRLFPELGVPELPAPSDDYLRLFESVASLVAHVASMQPLALMLEDLHWADEMSLRLLSFLGRRVHAWPVLVVVTAREEELVDVEGLRRALTELRGQAHVTEVVLSPLSRDETGRLVRHLTAAGREARAVARLEEQAWAASEGNAFVVVETVRALREGTRLEEPARLTLPERVREVVVRRVERVSDRGRQLLSLAAVIGRAFDFALLQRASGLTDRDAAEAVEELVRRRMLHGVDDGFDFTHDRIREVVYGALLPPRRKLLHGDVAAALEALTAGALDPPAAALGLHYRHAEVRDKAVFYLRQAGLRAAARSALQDARSSFERALDVLGSMPESPATLEQAVDIRLELRSVLYQLGEVRRGLERLREAETLAEKIGDDRRRARACAFRTNMHALLGELDEARASGTRALAIARELGDLELQILSTTFVGQVHHYQGEYAQQVEVARGNLAALPADWVYKNFGIGAPVSTFDRVTMLISLTRLGRFSEAAEHEAEVIRLAEPTGHPYTIGQAYMAGAVLSLHKGDWARARARAEHSVEILRSGNVVHSLFTALASSSWALAQLGEASVVLDRLREGEQFIEHHEAIIGLRPWAYQALGRACLLVGRLDDALCLCDRATASSPPGYTADALLLAADIATHPDRFDADTAEAHYRKALELADARGIRPLVAHCHLGLGELFQRTSRRSEAEQHLTAATAMYRDMEMLFYLEQAQSALSPAESRAGTRGP